MCITNLSNAKMNQSKSSLKDSEAARLAVFDFISELDGHAAEGLDWISEWCEGLGIDLDDATTDESGSEESESDQSEESGLSDPSDVSDLSELSDPHESNELSEPAAASDPSETSETPNSFLSDFRVALSDSLKELEGFRIGINPDSEEWKSVFSELFAALAAFTRGKLNIQFVSLLLKGIGYDKGLAVARAEGEIAGRNARIEEMLRTQPKSDGIPALSNRGGAHTDSRTRPASIFDLAAQARH